jgi:hypothetical protein
MSDEDARRAMRLAGKLARQLKGKGSKVQGAALADLTAIWLASHVVPGDPAGTERLRANMLAEQIAAIAKLTKVNAKIIGTELLATAPAGSG